MEGRIDQILKGCMDDQKVNSKIDLGAVQSMSEIGLRTEMIQVFKFNSRYYGELRLISNQP